MWERKPSGRNVDVLDLSSGSCQQIAFSPNGSFMAVLHLRAGKKTLQLLKASFADVPPYKPVATIDLTEHTPTSISFSPPPCNTLAVASRSLRRIVQLWDVGNATAPTLKATLSDDFNGREGIECVEFSPRREILATYDIYPQRDVILWDAAAKKVLTTLELPTDLEDPSIRDMAFSPDDQRLAVTVETDRGGYLVASNSSGTFPQVR